MKCSECGHDLMVAIVPSGLGRILNMLPYAPYRCVRCGNSDWRVSGGYTPQTALLFTLAWLIAAAGGVLWLTDSLNAPLATIERLITHYTAPAPQPISQPTLPIAEAPAHVADAAPAPKQPAAKTSPARPAQPDHSASPPLAPPAAEPAAPSATPTRHDALGVTETTLADAPAPIASALPNDDDILRGIAMPGQSASPSGTAPVPPSPRHIATPEPPARSMQAPAPVATAPAPTPLASNTTRTAQAPKPLPTAPPATQKAAPAVPASPTQRPKQPTSPAVATTIASADGARVVTITLRSTAPIESVRSYLLADPPRLVVDLPGTWEYRGATRIPVDKGIVRAVRTGIHADKLRVVLDLTAPPSRKPTVQKSDDGLSILVPPSS